MKRPRHIPVESFLPFVQTSGHRLKGLSVLSRQFGSRAKIRSRSLTVFSARRKYTGRQTAALAATKHFFDASRFLLKFHENFSFYLKARSQ